MTGKSDAVPPGGRRSAGTPAKGPGRPPADRRTSGAWAQRLIAALLTVGLFGLIILGAGALFRQFDMAGWGYAFGGAFCLVMAVAGWRSRDHDHDRDRDRDHDRGRGHGHGRRG